MRYGIEAKKNNDKVYMRWTNLIVSYGEIDFATSTPDLGKLAEWKALAEAESSLSQVKTVSYHTNAVTENVDTEMDDELIKSGKAKLTKEEERALGI
jgi:hypothetical protein